MNCPSRLGRSPTTASRRVPPERGCPFAALCAGAVALALGVFVDGAGVAAACLSTAPSPKSRSTVRRDITGRLSIDLPCLGSGHWSRAQAHRPGRGELSGLAAELALQRGLINPIGRGNVLQSRAHGFVKRDLARFGS